MSNPNRHIATIRIARVAGGTEIFIRSSILEEKIKADASAGPEPTRKIPNPPSWWPTSTEVYRVELPSFDGNYSITPDPTEETDIVNFIHLIRGVGLSKGVKVLIPRPMSVSMTQRMAKSIRDYMKHIYEEYYTDINVEYTLTQKVEEGEVASGSV